MDCQTQYECSAGTILQSAHPFVEIDIGIVLDLLGALDILISI